MLSVTNVRTAIVEYFNRKAAQREMLARERPTDIRNLQSAKALHAVAEHVQWLKNQDRLLLLFAGRRENLFEAGGALFMPPRFKLDGITPSTCDKDAFQCGFDSNVSDPGRWFETWVAGVVDLSS